MQPYDLIMLVVLVAAAAWGAWKGLAWQVASVCSIVFSFAVAARFSEQLAPHLSQEAPWNRFAAMLVLYVGTSAGIWLLFRMVKSSIDRIHLKDLDRQLGGLVGAVKGVLLCVAITFFAVTLTEESRQQVLKSRSGVYIGQLIDRAGPILPPSVQQALRPYLDRLNWELHGGYGGTTPPPPPAWTSGSAGSSPWGGSATVPGLPLPLPTGVGGLGSGGWLPGSPASGYPPSATSPPPQSGQGGFRVNRR